MVDVSADHLSADRLAALDGGLLIESPPGGGTLVMADIPVPA